MSTENNIREIAMMLQKAMTAQEASSRGLVPQSGNADKPGRWIKDPKAEESAETPPTEAKELTEDEWQAQMVSNLSSLPQSRLEFLEYAIEQAYNDLRQFGDYEPENDGDSYGP